MHDSTSEFLVRQNLAERRRRAAQRRLSVRAELPRKRGRLGLA